MMDTPSRRRLDTAAKDENCPMINEISNTLINERQIIIPTWIAFAFSNEMFSFAMDFAGRPNRMGQKKGRAMIRVMSSMPSSKRMVWVVYFLSSNKINLLKNKPMEIISVELSIILSPYKSQNMAIKFVEELFS